MDTIVSVHIKDMDLGQAIRVLADKSGINIMVGKDVQGKVGLRPHRRDRARRPHRAPPGQRL